MSTTPTAKTNETTREFAARTRGGMPVLLLNTLALLVFTGVFIAGVLLSSMTEDYIALGVVLIVLGAVLGFVVCPLLYGGLRVVKPNEAMVLTLFGRYIGTVMGEGFYFVNPFASSAVPAAKTATTAMISAVSAAAGEQANAAVVRMPARRLSMKAITLSNDKQKINDLLGNPIVIGIVVIWKITDTFKAVFNVENYFEFLSIQCDSALRNIVRLYPYDACDDEMAGEKSLRGSSQEIADRLRTEIQGKVDIAGLEILEARITHLAYAPEIAAAMLQRQQAKAIVDARQLIVEGAVGMVEMALDKLNERDVVHLDEERKAAMVSNLLVVLCGSKEAQPVVNSGSLY